MTGASFTPGQGKVIVNNTQDGSATQPEKWTIGIAGTGFLFDSTFRPVVCHWDYSGLDLSYAGQTIFTNLPTPGFAPAAGQTFAFSCTAGISGAGNQDTYFDDLLLTTSPAIPPDTGGPIISEFMAENKTTLEDDPSAAPNATSA